MAFLSNWFAYPLIWHAKSVKARFSSTSDAKLDSSVVGLSGREKIRILLVYSGIGVATATGFLAGSVVGRLSVVLAGLGLVTYIFGLRHGLDADHIAAIDNTTRKLMQQGKRPFTVGMWFSLGHSTIVVALIVALVAVVND